MPIASDLKNLALAGAHRIGELVFQANVSARPWVICHWRDVAQLRDLEHGGLAVHEGPAAARNLSIYTAEGHYRFAKGQLNLPRGWVLVVKDEEELRQALDMFYPAGVGLFLALQGGTLEVENLRDKLARQTGMYRSARTISDAGAQRLVQEVCGPAHQCAKRILWQLDAATPLDDSEATRYNGIPNDLPPAEAIPLLCREACNHFVAECRRVAKEETQAS